MLKTSEEGVKRTGRGRPMVMAIAPNRSIWPPANRLTQEVVLARSAPSRDVAEHVEDKSDGKLMVRRCHFSTEYRHGVRNVDAVELALPLRHCPAA